MRYLPQVIPMSGQDIAILSRFLPYKDASLKSVVRKVLTTYVDGKVGFYGKGFILFGKSFPTPLKSHRQIYEAIIECFYEMAPGSLDAFFEKSEAQFSSLYHRLWIRPIAKSKEDLYLYKWRPKKPCHKIGSYFIATTPNVENYERWLKLLLDANGLDTSDLTVFWNSSVI